MTEAKIRSLLPIGSVVVLRDTQRPLMIYGILQKERDTGKIHDYVGVLWPEGSGGEGTQFLFRHEDIVRVLFKGLNLMERDAFIDRLVAAAADKDEI